jgi:hypothetical protein
MIGVVVVRRLGIKCGGCLGLAPKGGPKRKARTMDP